jgi:hypothetical protein
MPIKTLKPDFPYLEFRVRIVEMNDKIIGVGFDKDKQVAQVTGDDIDDAERGIKQKLNSISNDFVAIEGAINIFRKVFPEGYGSPFYEFIEGSYKARAAEFVAERLSAERLSDLLESGNYSEICADAKRAVSKTGLPSPFEMMALSDFLKKESNQEPFSASLYDLLYGDDFATAFKKFTNLLSAQENAAKWPIVTYFPFFRFPQEHVFVKPALFETCAYRLGYELEYEPRPNIDSYRSCVGLVDMIREQIHALAPTSNIDIQTFMFVVATDGYVASVERERQEWEKKNAGT